MRSRGSVSFGVRPEQAHHSGPLYTFKSGGISEEGSGFGISVFGCYATSDVDQSLINMGLQSAKLFGGLNADIRAGLQAWGGIV